MKNENHLIALFMGATAFEHEKHPGVWYDAIEPFTHHMHESALDYHVSWDWLMPVVEKIERMVCCDEFRIESEQVVVRADAEYKSSRLYAIKYHHCHASDGTKIEAVYNAVVAFIKWFNDQPHPITNNPE